MMDKRMYGLNEIIASNKALNKSRCDSCTEYKRKLIETQNALSDLLKAVNRSNDFTVTLEASFKSSIS